MAGRGPCHAPCPSPSPGVLTLLNHFFHRTWLTRGPRFPFPFSLFPFSPYFLCFLAFISLAANLLWVRLRHLNSTAASVVHALSLSVLLADISQFQMSIKWKFYNFTPPPAEGAPFSCTFALSCDASNLMRFYLLTVDNRRAFLGGNRWKSEGFGGKASSRRLLMRFWVLYEAYFMAALVAEFGI